MKFTRYSFSLLIIFLLMSTFSFANEVMKIHHNGEPITLSSDVIMYDNQRYLPIRDVFDMFQFTVSWNQATQTVTGSKGEYHIHATVGKQNVEVNSITQLLQSPVITQDNKVYVPETFIVEILDGTVHWEQHFNRISVYTTTFNDPIYIESPILRKALLELVGKTLNDDLTKGDLMYLVNVDLSGKRISNINGIDHLVHVRQLNLDNNSIQNLEPLSSMDHLEVLTLNNNKLRTLGDLQPLFRLKRLEVTNNSIYNIDGLQDLIYLTHLDIKDNKLDIEEDLNYLYHLKGQLSIDVSLEFIEEPSIETKNLRVHTEPFKIKVSPDIFWVPADYHGSPSNKNKDMNNISINTVQGKKSQISNVYELLQYVEHTDYHFIDDDKTQYNSKTSRAWTYPKPPAQTLTENYGSALALSNAAAFLLSNNYSESGYLYILDINDEVHLINYIKRLVTYYNEDDDKNIVNEQVFEYSLFDVTQYQSEFLTNTAVESGRMTTYNNSKRIKSNIHMTHDLMTFVRAYMGNLEYKLVLSVNYTGDEDEHYPLGTYYNNRGNDAHYIFTPKNLDVKDDSNPLENHYRVLFDTKIDKTYIKVQPNGTKPPTWD